MPGPEFFQTQMGQKYYNFQLPKLIKALEEHTEALNRNTEMMAKFLEAKENPVSDKTE